MTVKELMQVIDEDTNVMLGDKDDNYIETITKGNMKKWADAEVERISISFAYHDFRVTLK